MESKPSTASFSEHFDIAWQAGKSTRDLEEIGDANFDYVIRRIKDHRVQMIEDKDTGNLLRDEQYLVRQRRSTEGIDQIGHD